MKMTKRNKAILRGMEKLNFCYPSRAAFEQFSSLKKYYAFLSDEDIRWCGMRLIEAGAIEAADDPAYSGQVHPDTMMSWPQGWVTRSHAKWFYPMEVLADGLEKVGNGDG